MIEYRCPNCGRVFTLKHVRKRVFCPCGQVAHNPSWSEDYRSPVGVQQVMDGDPWRCVYRGDTNGQLDCGCTGKPDTYSCEKHGTCAIRRMLPIHPSDIAFCNTCVDRSMYRQGSVGMILSVFNPIGGIETWANSFIKEIGSVVGIATSEDPRGKASVPIYTGRDAMSHLLRSAKNVFVWGSTEDVADVIKEHTECNTIAVHHGDLNSTWARSVFERQLQFCRKAVAVNKDVSKKYGVPWCPNFLSLDRSVPKKDLSSLKALGEKVVLWNHRLSPEKRPDLARDIADLLPDGWSLWMTGGGLIPNSDKVKDIGTISHPGDWLAIADVFLSTADQEAFGYSMAEAVLANVPVVASPFGLALDGYADVVESLDPKVWVDTILNVHHADAEKRKEKLLFEYRSEFVVNQWRSVLESDTHSRTFVPVSELRVGGPGTELFKMLKEIGIEDREGCSCKATAEQMDLWGAKGCRIPENFSWIVGEIDKNAEYWSWSEKLAIAAKASLNPSNWKLGWKINPLAVNRSLVEEAIRRAESRKKETGS